MGIVVLWSDSAMDELQEIYDYYKLKANDQIADKISNAIIDRTILLEDKLIKKSRRHLILQSVLIWRETNTLFKHPAEMLRIFKP